MRRLMRGNDAAVFGALMGGCTHFYGYPITPASEITELAAHYFTVSGRVFLQAESEVSAINMLYGASSAGSRVMTASSGPGIALMSEGLSYLAGSRLPSVVIDMQRAGPGLGNIWPEQGDYNMVVKGGGHGNYKNIVLTPASVQEMYDFTKKAFELADKYRMTVFILSDAYIGQMMEPIKLNGPILHGNRKEWAIYGDKESRHNLISSIYMSPSLLRKHNELLQAVYSEVEQAEVDYENYYCDDASTIFVAYGIVSRICKSAVQQLRKKGLKAGMFRLKTAFPFPNKELYALAKEKKRIIVVEMSNGQMAADVELAVKGSEIEKVLVMGGETPQIETLIKMVSEIS